MTLKISIKGLKELQRNIQKNVQIKSEAIAKDVSKTVIAKLKENTPVDTGEARDGWYLSEKGFHLSIHNDVEHIGLLNEGHSQQAPTHFIERTILSVPGVRPNGIITKSN